MLARFYLLHRRPKHNRGEGSGSICRIRIPNEDTSTFFFTFQEKKGNPLEFCCFHATDYWLIEINDCIECIGCILNVVLDTNDRDFRMYFRSILGKSISLFMDMTAGPLLICIRCILYSIVHLPTSVTFLPHPVLQKFFVRNPWCLKLFAGRDKIKFSVLGEVASTWKKQKKRRVGIFKKSSAEKLMRETLSRLSAFYKFDYGFCIYLKLSCSSFSRERSARKNRCAFSDIDWFSWAPF